MKTRIKLIGTLLFVFLVSTTFAQEINYSKYGKIVVTESTTIIDGFESPAYVVYFEDEILEMEDAWKSYLKSNYDVKLRKSRGFLKAEEVSLPEISNKSVTLYSSFEAERPMPKFLVTVAVSRDTFISSSSHPEEARNIKSMMIKFVKTHQLELVNEALEKDVKIYEKMNSELAKIEKDKAGETKSKIKSEGNIVKYGNDIQKDKRKILDIEAEVKVLEQKIEKEKSAVSDFENKMKDLQKNIDEKTETITRQKEKIDKIRAKKDLILSQSSARE